MSTAPVRVVRVAVPRRDQRHRRFPVWRLLVLLAAIAATIAAAWMNAPAIAQFLERAWWHIEQPAAVQQLAGRAGYSTLDLEWQKAADDARYRVTVATDAGFDHIVDRLHTTSTTAAFDGLAEGTTYYYRVHWTSALGNQAATTVPRSVVTEVHPLAAPTTVAMSAQSSSAFNVTWGSVPYATTYVVRLSTSADPARFGASPSDIEFPATAATSLAVTVPQAALDVTYYATVRAENDHVISDLSVPAQARLRLDPPSNVSVAGTSTSSVTLSWDGVPNASGYVIERSGTSDFGTVDASYTVPRAYTRMAVSGLVGASAYFFRVHAMNGDQAGIDSPPITGATDGGPALSLRIATYNVLDATSGKDVGSWKERRHNVAATIRSAGASIIGLQEANSTTRLGIGTTQARDIARLTGFSLATSAGLRGNQFLYDAHLYDLGRSGVFHVPQAKGDGYRTAIWQVFVDRATGSRFLVVNAHLSNGDSSYDDQMRASQAAAMMRELTALDTGLPSILLGDLNSWDTRTDVTPMSTFASNGYVDAGLSTPLTDSSTINTWVKAKSTDGRIRLDHIAVPASVAVDQTEVIADAKTPASDHRLMWASISIAGE